MRPPEVWQHFCAPGDKEARALARAALTQAGLDADDIGDVTAQQTGIVFFTQVTRELQLMLRRKVENRQKEMIFLEDGKFIRPLHGLFDFKFWANKCDRFVEVSR